MSYFESRHVGDLLSRFGSTQPIQSLLTTGFVNAAIDAILALTTLVVMALLNVQLALLTVATVVLYLIFRTLMYPALRRRRRGDHRPRW
jgi:ATP-binding cassette subfamily B protein RaxB